MDQSEARNELRSAIYGGDIDFLKDVLSGPAWPDDSLQLLGDAVLMITRERADDIESAARRCVKELWNRDWEGDVQLAVQIEAALGWGPSPLLRPLPVDLEELAGSLEGDPMDGGGAIDLRDGQVWPKSVWDNDSEDWDLGDPDDDERWLWFGSEGSRSGYQDMEFFIDMVEDEQVAERLAWAIQGRGAFRRFKDALSWYPELQTRWYGFSEDRHLGRARAWLAAEGYHPVPRVE